MWNGRASRSREASGADGASRSREASGADGASPRASSLAAALLLGACGGEPEPTPVARPEPAAPAAPAAARQEHERLEVFASYLVDEGWGVRLVLTHDGCFRKTDEVGGPGTEDTVVRCVACVPADVSDALFDAARRARLVPEERQYPRAIEAPGGLRDHVGRYALLAYPADGAPLGPADEASARSLVAPIQRLLEEAERAIDAEARRCCTPPPGGGP